MRVITMLSVILLCFFSCKTKSLNQLPPELRKQNYQEIKLPIGSSSTSSDLTVPPDRFPMYINGLDGLMSDLYQNLSYPKEEYEKGVEGRVLLEFIVNELGEIDEVKVVESVSENIDKEAISAVKKLKKYYPGYNKGKPIRVRYKLPIIFKLS